VTHRLYYTDSYLRDFEATILERSDGGRRVYLDRTAFYPTSGGQLCDTGRLGEIEVTEVVDEGERIAHLLAEPLAGERTAGRLHWPRRFDHMQQHTGQHLLSAVLADLLGTPTISVHFGQETSTLDLAAGQVTREQLVRAEDRANEIITENRTVEVTFEEAAEAAGLRKPSDRGGTLRIVTIHDLDRSSCGGTHVRATGEIGAILIRRVERVRRGVRLEFVCGGRAVRAARTDHDLLSTLAGDFSAAAEELPRLVGAQRAELQEAGSARRELEATLDLYRARELYAEAQPDSLGVRRVVIREATGPLNRFKGLAQAFASLPQAIFVGASDNPPSVMLASSNDSGVDAGGVLKGLLLAAGGRGGGSGSLAQGMLPGREQLESVLASLSHGSQKSKV
jgi:alanyl-tRNA synthetase